MPVASDNSCNDILFSATLKSFSRSGMVSLVCIVYQGLGKPNKIYVYDLLKADNDNWLPKPFVHRKGRTNEKEIL